MDFERTAIKFGEGSIGVIIPADLARYLEISPGDKLMLREDVGKKGKFGSFWKKENGD